MQQNIDKLKVHQEKINMQEKQIEYAINKKSDIELIKMAIINILPHRSNFDRFECSPLLLSKHFSISLTLYSEVSIY